MEYGYVEIIDILGYRWRTMSVQMGLSKSSKGRRHIFWVCVGNCDGVRDVELIGGLWHTGI